MVEKTLRAKQAKTITNLSNKHDKKTDRQNKLTRRPLIEKKTDQMKMSPPPHKSTRNRRRTSWLLHAIVHSAQTTVTELSTSISMSMNRTKNKRKTVSGITNIREGTGQASSQFIWRYMYAMCVPTHASVVVICWPSVFQDFGNKKTQRKTTGEKKSKQPERI